MRNSYLEKSSIFNRKVNSASDFNENFIKKVIQIQERLIVALVMNLNKLKQFNYSFLT